MSTVIIEFSVDGLPIINGDNVFHADTDMTKEEWDALSEADKDDTARILFNEQVQYGWHEAPEGTEI